MRTLCIDTSVNATIALVEDGAALARAVDTDPRHQAEGLGVLLEQVVAEAGIDGGVREAAIDRVAVGVGPGPFTALRAGIAFAAAVARGLDVPVYGIPSLEVVAWQMLGGGAEVVGRQVLVLTDARRKEVYSALFALGESGIQTVVEPRVGNLENALSIVGDSEAEVYFSGTRPAHLEEVLASVGAKSLDLDAAVLADILEDRLQRGLGKELTLEPLYLRRPDIHGGTA
ncbi:tRNA (adenosine(37)-N6)-threonylcarbamoyltransferase complex dimerization subunit type 1 TsaB [Actinomyces minihominis]|uniref:tRNA (adenosine(37)-N6)-threonylcarbamoyltransferase complex dimerization subunit type 1 TsaB n=1 Tax=Actinomyces minihominis TaxID=2002838 RepID=UPI000C07D8E7|nr:tRNA (adenosine(37)-N6)-threonylcarbamoyltransferase complex dimerization subunit type 1 TsaB [Actinomyces minihominis]